MSRTVRSVYRFTAELWRHEGEVSWCFVTLPRQVSDDIRERTDGGRSGFGTGFSRWAGSSSNSGWPTNVAGTL